MTLVYPYYRNPAMLAIQYQRWAAYPRDLLDSIEIIIVDDASPEPAIEVPRPDLPLRIYRVSKDIPWHQDGARNLAAREAREGMIFFGDMDHVLPEDTVRALLTQRDHSLWYRFNRQLLSGEYKLKPGANIFACARETFWRTGGYDEDLCGYYGTDIVFREKLQRVAGPSVLIPESVVVYLATDCGDCCTVGLPRTGEANKRGLQAAIKRKDGLPPKVLGFDWDRQL